jgi:hypothetical protein
LAKALLTNFETVSQEYRPCGLALCRLLELGEYPFCR